MTTKADGVNSVNEIGMSGDEAAASTVCAHRGKSGTGGTGADVSGTAVINCLSTYGFYPRIVRVDGAGNFGFTTLDDNPHVIAMDAKSELRSIFIKTIYPASYATAGLRTTATGVHLF
jgi:hypothetical protein